MNSCQKILTNNARKACVCFHFFLLFFKATSRRHSHLSGMRIKIKVYHPSSICFPRQVRKVMAFKVLWATVPSCKHRIVQGPQWVLVLSCSPLGEAQLCWLQPVLPFPPPRHRVYSRTAWAFPLSQVCCWSELSKIMVQGGESRGWTAAQSLKGQRELAPFGESFPTTDILLMNLMHLLCVLAVSSAWTFFYLYFTACVLRTTFCCCNLWWTSFANQNNLNLGGEDKAELLVLNSFLPETNKYLDRL